MMDVKQGFDGSPEASSTVCAATPESAATKLIASWGDELYVPCPRCYGHRQVFAYTRMGDGYQPSTGEYFTCPLCHGTAEADRDRATEFVTEREEDEDR